jgi:hypothetical protein
LENGGGNGWEIECNLRESVKREVFNWLRMGLNLISFALKAISTFQCLVVTANFVPSGLAVNFLLITVFHGVIVSLKNAKDSQNLYTVSGSIPKQILFNFIVHD